MSLLKACTTLVAVLAKHGRESEIEALVVEMKVSGLNPDAFFFNAVLRNYGVNGHIHLASRVLFQMEKHEIQPNNTTYERVSFFSIRLVCSFPIHHREPSLHTHYTFWTRLRSKSILISGFRV